MTERYLDGRTYLRLKESAEIDNPDQRIAEDTRAFTTTTLSFTLIFLNAALAAVSFSGVLWTISPLLFGVAVGYAALGTLMTVLLGRPLVGLNYRQSDREADFRAALIHVRENAESVALLRREGRLTARLLRRIDELVANFRRITSVNRNLGFFTTGLQLPDPDHPDPDRGPAVHPRGGRVRRDHAVGDGLHPAPRGVLAHHQPVRVDLLVRRGRRPAERARGGRREEGRRCGRGSRRSRIATGSPTSG